MDNYLFRLIFVEEVFKTSKIEEAVARSTSLLKTHPLICKSVTAGLMNAIADLFCQRRRIRLTRSASFRLWPLGCSLMDLGSIFGMVCYRGSSQYLASEGC